MMETNGWIKIHRKLLDWEWADDPYMLCFWIRLLLTVNEKDKKHHGNVIKRGQLLTSIHQISDTLGWSRNTVKRILKHLSDCKQIKVESNSQGTLITVINFGKYQDRGGSDSGSLSGSTSGSIDEPQDNISGSNNEPQGVKTSVSGSLGGSLGGSMVDPYTFHNVELKPAELRKLQMDYGEAETQSAINDLSCKLMDGSTESNAHYATLTYWLANRRKKKLREKESQPKGRDLIGNDDEFITDNTYQQ